MALMQIYLEVQNSDDEVKSYDLRPGTLNVPICYSVDQDVMSMKDGTAQDDNNVDKYGNNEHVSAILYAYQNTVLLETRVPHVRLLPPDQPEVSSHANGDNSILVHQSTPQRQVFIQLRDADEFMIGLTKYLLHITVADTTSSVSERSTVVDLDFVEVEPVHHSERLQVTSALVELDWVAPEGPTVSTDVEHLRAAQQHDRIERGSDVLSEDAHVAGDVNKPDISVSGDQPQSLQGEPPGAVILANDSQDSKVPSSVESTIEVLSKAWRNESPPRRAHNGNAEYNPSSTGAAKHNEHAGRQASSPCSLMEPETVTPRDAQCHHRIDVETPNGDQLPHGLPLLGNDESDNDTSNAEFRTAASNLPESNVSASHESEGVSVAPSKESQTHRKGASPTNDVSSSAIAHAYDLLSTAPSGSDALRILRQGEERTRISHGERTPTLLDRVDDKESPLLPVPNKSKRIGTEDTESDGGSTSGKPQPTTSHGTQKANQPAHIQTPNVRKRKSLEDASDDEPSTPAKRMRTDLSDTTTVSTIKVGKPRSKRTTMSSRTYKKKTPSTLPSSPGPSPSTLNRDDAASTASTAEAYAGPPPRVLFSSNSSADEKPHILSFLARHGGRKVSSVREANILCVGPGPLKKTSKFLVAILSGTLIVRDAWLVDSAKRRHLLDLEPYIADDPVRELEWGMSLREAIERGKMGVKPLAGLTLHFTPALKGELGGGFAELRDVALLAGAESVLARVPSKAVGAKERVLVLASRADDDVLGIEKGGWKCFHKDLVSVAVLRGRLDLESDEFRLRKDESPRSTAGGAGGSKRKLRG